MILIVHGLINVFRSHLVSLFTALGVVARARCRGDRRDPDLGPDPPREHLLRVRPHDQQLGLQGRLHSVPFFWLYVLPLGFLLTMYTITGYDASAHVSEEPTAPRIGAEGVSGAPCSTRR